MVMCKWKILKIAKTMLKKKNKVGGLRFWSFNNYYKAAVLGAK